MVLGRIIRWLKLSNKLFKLAIWWFKLSRVQIKIDKWYFIDIQERKGRKFKKFECLTDFYKIVLNR